MDGNLLGVIVGGIIAIAAGAVGPWIQHTLAAKDRKAERKRQSTLDVVEAIFRHNQYMDTFRQNMMFAQESALPPNPLAQIEGIISVDFPQCHKELSVFRFASSKIASWATDFGAKRLGGENPDLSGWREVIDAYTLATSNLIAALTNREQISAEQVAAVAAKRLADANGATNPNSAVQSPA